MPTQGGQRTIVVDTAEPDEIYEEIKAELPETECKPLNIGDYLIFGTDKTVVFERKTIGDLIRSARHKHLWMQLKLLSDFVKNENGIAVLIIEGDVDRIPDHMLSPTVRQELAGIISAIALDWRIPMIPSPHKRWTTRYLILVNERLGREKRPREYAIRHGSRVSEENEPLYIVQGFPGCGGVRSKALLRRFGSVSAIVGAELEDLRWTPSVGHDTAERIYKAVRRKWSD